MRMHTSFVLLAPLLANSLPVRNIVIVPDLLPEIEDTGCLTGPNEVFPDDNDGASVPGTKLVPGCLIETNKLSHEHNGSFLLKPKGNTTSWHPIANRPLDVDKRPPPSTIAHSQKVKRGLFDLDTFPPPVPTEDSIDVYKSNELQEALTLSNSAQPSPSRLVARGERKKPLTMGDLMEMGALSASTSSSTHTSVAHARQT
ncbi:Fc.00g020280.m01.CDS01 [Cosmosporella sp. VM-42]